MVDATKTPQHAHTRANDDTKERALRDLALCLRPAGGGLYLVSTGKAEQEEWQRRFYGVSSAHLVQEAFLASLEKVKDAKTVVLAIPSDVGAGFRRGANLGPREIRRQLLEDDAHLGKTWEQGGIVDLGDVFVVPQLLSDDMLHTVQKERVQAHLYPTLSTTERAYLPVSPLSIAEYVLDLVFQLNPRSQIFLIGGDHSTAWPAAASLAKHRRHMHSHKSDLTEQKTFAIVQSDAHTDLLSERLGIKTCFATWSYHANDLIGRQKRLIQVGTRASGRTKEHWESTLDVVQYWADFCNQDQKASIDAVMQHAASLDLPIYFSNDIDGTDAQYADATGTPEFGGLSPSWLLELIARMGDEVGLVGGDIMEVAPFLGPDNGATTVKLAATYTRETLRALQTPASRRWVETLGNPSDHAENSRTDADSNG